MNTNVYTEYNNQCCGWAHSFISCPSPRQVCGGVWSWSSRPVGRLTLTASGTSLTAPGSSLTSRVTSATIASFLNLGTNSCFAMSDLMRESRERERKRQTDRPTECERKCKRECKRESEREGQRDSESEGQHERGTANLTVYLGGSCMAR